ncbi:ras association domain-containing protein 10-like [Haemaphysalis longicornis]
MGAEVPIWVGGVQKWVTGVSRRTTCDEVVRALLASGRSSRKSSSSHHGDPQQYALVEVCPRGIERRLEADSRILKLWNAEDDVRLSMRRVRCWSSTTSSPTSDSCVAEPPRHHHHHYHRRRHHHSHHRRTQTSGGSSSTTTTSSSASPRLLRTVHPRKLSGGATSQPSSPHQQEQHSEELAELVKLVICQSETLDRQAALLSRHDAEIEHHEAKMHAMRVRQMGPDYMLDGYRPEVSEEDSLQMYQATLEAYDRVLQLCRRITAEEEKVQRLSAEVRQRTWEHEQQKRRSEEQLRASREGLAKMEGLREFDQVLEEKMRVVAELERQLRLAEQEEEVQLLVRRTQMVGPPRPDSVAPVGSLVVAAVPMSVASPTRCCIDAQDSSSDTGVSSMYSFEEVGHVLDTLV